MTGGYIASDPRRIRCLKNGSVHRAMAVFSLFERFLVPPRSAELSPSSEVEATVAKVVYELWYYIDDITYNIL